MAIMKKELVEDIVNWSKSVFPDLTAEKQTLKLNEEMDELERAETQEEKMYEMADIFIVATILHKRFKSELGRRISSFYDLFEIEPYVEKKMKRNKERVWKKVSNGTYHHEESEKDE